ncbi:MAG: glycosyltransferase family 2 protein [Bacteroidetes bacterium]|nr:glycosyltransferase family 2 protein [Bacteroidota bacterium]
MKVSGFTFIRNAVKFDYPIKEAILSILPLCDEVIVMLGQSEDGTRELLQSISDNRIKIIDSTWDDSLREGGKVLADETNKALSHVAADSDWAFYIQGDEVLHEHSYEAIKDALKKYKDDSNVEGLLFNYRHFYGSYDYVGNSRKWYRKEIRVIKNDKTIKSYKDAQGFRKNGKKLKVKPVYAFIHHYGWVKPPKAMQEKQKEFHKMWHDDKWVEANIPKLDEFDYSKIDSLAVFRGTHPEVIKERIKRQNWKFTFDPTTKKMPLLTSLLHGVEQFTGWRPGEYKNYKII